MNLEQALRILRREFNTPSIHTTFEMRSSIRELFEHYNQHFDCPIDIARMLIRASYVHLPYEISDAHRLCFAIQNGLPSEDLQHLLNTSTPSVLTTTLHDQDVFYAIIKNNRADILTLLAQKAEDHALVFQHYLIPYTGLFLKTDHLEMLEYIIQQSENQTHPFSLDPILEADDGECLTYALQHGHPEILNRLIHLSLEAHRPIPMILNALSENIKPFAVNHVAILIKMMIFNQPLYHGQLLNTLDQCLLNLSAVHTEASTACASYLIHISLQSFNRHTYMRILAKTLVYSLRNIHIALIFDLITQHPELTLYVHEKPILHQKLIAIIEQKRALITSFLSQHHDPATLSMSTEKLRRLHQIEQYLHEHPLPENPMRIRGSIYDHICTQTHIVSDDEVHSEDEETEILLSQP